MFSLNKFKWGINLVYSFLSPTFTNNKNKNKMNRNELITKAVLDNAKFGVGVNTSAYTVQDLYTGIVKVPSLKNMGLAYEKTLAGNASSRFSTDRRSSKIRFAEFAVDVIEDAINYRKEVESATTNRTKAMSEIANLKILRTEAALEELKGKKVEDLDKLIAEKEAALNA